MHPIPDGDAALEQLQEMRGGADGAGLAGEPSQQDSPPGDLITDRAGVLPHKNPGPSRTQDVFLPTWRHYISESGGTAFTSRYPSRAYLHVRRVIFTRAGALMGPSLYGPWCASTSEGRLTH